MRLNFSRVPIALLMAGALPAQAQLIISEYIEGSGHNKAIELSNIGSATLDLSEYQLDLYTNGNQQKQFTQALSGELAPQTSFVIANALADEPVIAQADLTSNITFFNGNDVIALLKNDVVIDRIGQLGHADYFAKDVTLVRHFSISEGDPHLSDDFDPNVEWSTYAKDHFDFLGSHNESDTGEGEPPATINCGDPVTFISTIQSEQQSSPLLGEMVAIEGIVVANYQSDDQLGGFFIQEEISDQDTNPLTSEGLFVYHNTHLVQVGDRVILQGVVDEFYELTQINNVSQLTICDTDNPLPPAAVITLPLTAMDQLESVEGMRIQVTSSNVAQQSDLNKITVNEVYQLGRYGEFTIANGRRFIPTEIATPGEAAQSVMAENALNQLIVDDGMRAQNPSMIPFPAPQLDAFNSLRAGDTLDSLTGVINYAYGQYKLLPTEPLMLNGDNARSIAPEHPILITTKSALRIASFNVLNYFNGDGLGGGFPTARGASTVEELERQETKLVRAITEINADVLGLMEIENDGFSENSAIAALVTALNQQQVEGQEYEYVKLNRERLGDDDIAVGLIYRPSKVALVQAAQVLDSSNSPLDAQGNPLFVDALNRPALAQSIRDIRSGTEMTLVVNHFKSKGNRQCADYDDCDLGDGQGAYNHTRTRAAAGMAQWLASNPTGVNTQHILVLGDLNAYSQEDPIQTFAQAGFHSLKSQGDYSYVYYGQAGNLDHALATKSFAQFVTSTQDWHINTDEPRVLDYNMENKTPEQITAYFSDHAYRSSDHDPVIVDLAFDTNQLPVADFTATRFLFWWILRSTSHDADGHISEEIWNIGDRIWKGPWAIVSNFYLRHHDIREARLTVFDDEHASTSVLKTFR